MGYKYKYLPGYYLAREAVQRGVLKYAASGGHRNRNWQMATGRWLATDLTRHRHPARDSHRPRDRPPDSLARPDGRPHYSWARCLVACRLASQSSLREPLRARLLRPYREKRQNRAAAAGAAWLRLRLPPPPPRAVQRDRGGSRTCFGAVCATQRPPHPAKPPKTWFLRPSTEARLGARLHVGLVASESSAGTPAPQSTDFHTV